MVNIPMNFNVTECINFIDIISDSTLPLTFKNLLLVKIWYIIKLKYSSWGAAACGVTKSQTQLND